MTECTTRRRDRLDIENQRLWFQILVEGNLSSPYNQVFYDDTYLVMFGFSTFFIKY